MIGLPQSSVDFTGPKFKIISHRLMAENGFAPPLGNFADISYLVEN